MHRRTRGRSLALLGLAAMLALGLAACGDDDDEPAQATSTTEAEAQGSDTIQIEYVDYAYAVSGALNAGGTIEFENSGKEFHMVGATKLKPGKTLDDVKAVVEQAFAEQDGGGEGGEDEDNPAVETTRASRSQGATTTTAEGGEGGEGGGEDENPFDEVGEEVGLPGNVMAPGAAASVTLPDLEPGTYAILCFIPTEGEGTPHAAKGMINQFEVVEADAAPAEPTADATYKVEKGKAVAGPATLTPGEHTIKFEGVGDASELEPAIFRINPGTSLTQFDQKLTQLFESEEPPPKGAAASIPGLILWSGFDLEDTTSYYVTVDLEPGNYVIAAEDSDEEDAPAIPKELIQVKVA